MNLKQRKPVVNRYVLEKNFPSNDIEFVTVIFRIS